MAFVDISLYVKVEGSWSDAIIGTGGSSFVANEKSGLYTSDEAFKMAVTDAISVACKQLGIGAAIYSGSKYPTSPETPKTPETPKVPEVPQMTEEQKTTLIKHASLVEIFTPEQRKGILEWTSKPQTFESAQKAIEKNEKAIIEHPKKQS